MHIGVVGLGHWGSNHVRVLSAARHVDSVHVFDVIPDRVAATVGTARRAVAASSPEEVFAVADAVVIATHPSSHVELASAALLSGCHVLVEKPLALDVGGALELAELARALGRTLMVGHTFVFHPALQALRGMLTRGELGQVRLLESRRLNLGLYRSDCDVLWDLGPHDLSILNVLMGRPPVSVRAWGTEVLVRGTVDSAQLHLQYPDGVQALVSLSWCWPQKVRELTVVGTSGTAVFDDTDRAAPLRLYDSRVVALRHRTGGDPTLLHQPGSMRVEDVSTAEPLALEDQHFVDCAHTGAEPSTGVDDAIAVIRTLQAAGRSLAERREVHLEEVAARPGPARLASARAGGPR